MNQIVYNSISSIKWNPLEFYCPGFSFNLKKQAIHFNSKCFFNLYDCFFNIKDSAVNNKTHFSLTNLSNNKDFYEELKTPKDVFNFKKIISPAALFVDGEYFLLEEIEQKVAVLNKKTFDKNNSLTFELSSREILSVLNSDNKYLSLSSAEIGAEAFFAEKNSNYIQHFNYLLGSRDINLFLTDSFYNLALGVNRQNNFNLQIIQPSFLNEESIKIRLVSYNNSLNKPKEDDGVPDSYVSNYKINPLNFKNLEINPSSFHIPFFQNYLIQFSINPSNIGSNIYELNICPLKNYQTPEYTYNNKSLNRIYKRIFSGTNQAGGLNNVYLGYESFSKKINFKEDLSTSFLYPSSSSLKSITASNFIEDGATGGPVPFISDRIFVKDVKNTPVPLYPPGSAINPYMKWMCSWLFKGENDQYSWLDRFYDSSLYSLTDAISATFSFEFNNISFNFESLEDWPSSLQLTPGYSYDYVHIGKNLYNQHLEYLKNYYLDAESLHFSKWNTQPLISTNNKLVKGFVFPNTYINYNPDVFVLSGREHVSIPIVDNLLPTNKFSVNLWLKVDDWNNFPDCQVFGNYYDSGFGFLHDSSNICPIFSLISKDESGNFTVSNFNFNFENISKQNFPDLQIYSDINTLIRLPDLGFWVLDTYYNKAYKFKSNGFLDVKINNIFPEYTEFNIISQVEINSLEELIIYSSSKQIVKKITPKGEILNIDSNLINDLQSNSKRLEINSKNELIFSQSSVSVLDNYDNLWEVYGRNIYKNKNNPLESNPKISLVGPVHQMAFDSDNNLWISHGVDRISKFSPSGEFIFNGLRMGKRVGLNEETELQSLPPTQFRYIHFIKKPSVCNPEIIEDVALLIDTRDEEIFFIEQNGFLRNRLNLNAFVPESDFLKNSFFCRGDISGFNFLRKFKNQKNKKKLSWKIKTKTFNNVLSSLSLDYNPSLLSPGWHMFSLIFNGTNGSVEYYIDTIKVDLKTIPENSSVSYSLRTPLLIGAFTHQNFILNDLLNIQNIFKFKGDLADLVLYNTNLSELDLITIFNSTNPIKNENDFSMNWNMPTGSINYIEGVEHWFKNQLPGHKSNYFNLNIYNLKLGEESKNIIEGLIKQDIEKLIPTHTYLNKINWK